MIARVAAWGLVLAFCYGVWQFGLSYSSPWKQPVSPVISKLPPAAPGCTEDCRK